MTGRWFIPWIVFALLLVTGTACADDLGRDRLLDALDTTDRRIETAARLVTEAPGASTLADAELGVARDLQTRARGSFTANQYAISLRQTMDARGHADRAIAIVRGLPDPDRVRDQVERTRDILDRTSDRLQACEVVRARALLRVATDMQQRAENRLGASMYLGALQLTMSARERLLKAMQMCNVDESLGDAVDRALQRTNEVLGRAEDVVDSDSPASAREALARAQSLQVQAQTEAKQQHLDSALRMTQGARALAQRAMRLGRGQNGRMR